MINLIFYDIKNKARYEVQVPNNEVYTKQIEKGYIYFYDINQKCKKYISFAEYSRVEIYS